MIALALGAMLQYVSHAQPAPFVETCHQTGGAYGVMPAFGLSGRADVVFLRTERPVLVSISFADPGGGANQTASTVEWRTRENGPLQSEKVHLGRSLTFQATWAQIGTQMATIDTIWCARVQPLP